MARRNHATEAAEIAATIATRINELRAARGYSLDELGQRAGLAKAHVWELEHGRSANPTIATCAALARALGVSLEYLTGLTSKKPALHPDALRIALEVDHLLKRRKK